MPYVQRDLAGKLCAVSQVQQPGFSEWINDSEAEVLDFLSSINPVLGDLTASDLSFVRVVEDVIELMVEKNLIRFTDLPSQAQDKMLVRRRLRSKLNSSDFHLFNDEEDLKLL